MAAMQKMQGLSDVSGVLHFRISWQNRREETYKRLHLTGKTYMALREVFQKTICGNELKPLTNYRQMTINASESFSNAELHDVGPEKSSLQNLIQYTFNSSNSSDFCATPY